jgi:hypothetical protein
MRSAKTKGPDEFDTALQRGEFEANRVSARLGEMKAAAQSACLLRNIS